MANERDWSKRKLYKEWKVYVDDRLYEISHTDKRKDFIVALLRARYPSGKVTVEKYNHYETGTAAKTLEKKIEAVNKQMEDMSPALKSVLKTV